MEQNEEKNAVAPIATEIHIGPTITKAHLAAAREQVENAKAMLLIALSATNRADWMDMGGKPYLLSSGCNKMREMLRISFTDMRVDIDTLVLDGTTTLQCVCKLVGWYMGEPIPEQGTASTNDDFFGWRKIQGQRVRLPLSEIDIPSLRKKAITNAKDRVVRAAKGLGSLTWEDLAAAGIKRDAIGAVSYAKPGNNAPVPNTAGRIRLQQMIHDLATHHSQSFDDLLRQYTSFKTKEGKERSAASLDAMSQGWIDTTIPKVQKDWDAIQPAREPGAEG